MSSDDGDFDPHDDAPDWTDEDEERYQTRRREELRRRRRRRRQGWSFAVLVLVVLAAGLAGAGISQGWWEWPFGDEADASTGPDCTLGEPTVATPADVQVAVLNATDLRGLAGKVAAQLTARGYVVERVGNDDSAVDVAESAQVRYGPGLVTQARSLALQFPGAVLVDDGRSGQVVDVAIGSSFRRMAVAEEAAAALAAAAPTPPPECSTPASGTTAATTTG